MSGSAFNVFTQTPLPLKYLHQSNPILEKSSNLITEVSFFYLKDKL